MIPGNLHTVKRRRVLLSMRDVWYDSNAYYTDADVVYYTQMDKPMGDEWYDQYTILIDLEQSKEVLFEQIQKRSREEIRSMLSKTDFFFSAIAEGITRTLLNEFIECYNRFANAKKIPAAEVHRLSDYLENGLLTITRVFDKNNVVVAWHAYRVNADRVFLIYSITTAYLHTDSKMKNEIGAANKFCHWKDLEYFKNLGVKLYDFGGWYNGNTDKELLGINNFKEKFGGIITPNYNGIQYVTLKGKLFRLLKYFKNKSQA